MRHSRPLMIVVALLVLLCGLAAWAIWTSEPRTDIVSTATGGAMAATDDGPIPHVEVERVPLGQGQVANDQPGHSVAAAATPDGVPIALQPESLKLAIESSLVGQLEPGAFLDTALALSKLEIGKTPLPPNESCEMRYPVLGTPAGVTAELWVMSGEGTDFATPVMTYKIDVAPPDKYVFEGAMRRDISALMAMWTDKDGNVKHFNVTTDCMVSGESRRAGLDWGGRTVPLGVFFSHAVDRPFDTTYHNRIFEDGRIKASTGPLPILRGEWPRVDDLNILKSSWLNQYSTLQKTH